MPYEIRNRYNNAVIHTNEAESRDDAIRSPIANGANLTRADLTGANLYQANLRYANLYQADLTRADLTRANLRYANLTEADLTEAELTRADLTYDQLVSANTRAIRADLYESLPALVHEIAAHRQLLMEGKIDGQVYEGACACFVGSIANIRGVKYRQMPDLIPNSSRPIERFYLAIRKGDTPETNAVSRLVVEWIDAWVAEHVQ
jgi:hypothetical protein